MTLSLLKTEMVMTVIATVTLILVSNVAVRVVANAYITSAELSLPNVMELSSSSSSAINSALDILHEQTPELLRDSYDAIVEQTRQIRNQIDDWSTAVANNAYEFEYLRKASAVALANASLPQLQIISDAVSMLGANYAYDAVEREANLHRDCIGAAYNDLSSAAQIIVDESTTAGSDISNPLQMLRAKDYVLSAVQHLQDSCPLCRVLKYAASDANQNLLPFVTVLSSSILRTLHPFLVESAPASPPLPL